MSDTNTAGTNTYTGSFDMLKGIWGSCIFYNLFYIILLKFSNIIQAIWIIFTGVLCVGYILTHHEKKTENRLICGVLLVNLWFLQNLCYQIVLPLYIDVYIGSATVVTSLLYYISGNIFAFGTTVFFSLLPSNIIKGLPISHVEVHILFFVVYWYLTEVYIYITKQNKSYDISRQIAIVIPIFSLPFHYMCVYYLCLSYATAYTFYQEYKLNPIKEEEVKIEVTPEIIITEEILQPEIPLVIKEEIPTKPPTPEPPKPVKLAKPKLSLLARIPTRIQPIQVYNVPAMQQQPMLNALEPLVTPMPTFEVGSKLKNLYN